MRFLLISAVSLLLVGAPAAAKTPFSCAVAIVPTSDPGYTGLRVTASIPNNSVPYLRIDGSLEWTALHNTHGAVDDFTTRLNFASGTHTAEIIDFRKSNVLTWEIAVITSCEFTS